MNYKSKNMKRLLAIVPATMLAFATMAQDEGANLLENGSFESTDGKVKRLGSIEVAKGWLSPTGVRADLFSADSKMPDASAPVNVYGMEDAKDGSNYAGIVVYSYGDKMKRSYIMAKFSSPMKKGMRYKVEFGASLAELSKFSSNKLGAVISKKPFGTDDKVPALIEETSILHPEEVIFNGMYNWDNVCGEYIAEGGEKYITIGNFTNNVDVKQERNKKPKTVKGSQMIAAYYYIDDVKVTMLGPNEKCDCGYAAGKANEVTLVYQKTPDMEDNMTVAEKVAAQGIYYAKGRYNIGMADEKTIDFIAEQMKANPNTSLTIMGHTDIAEAEEGMENEKMADIGENRAEFVRTKLIEAGVDGNRIMVKNKRNGNPSPDINEGDDEDLQRAKNRRVTFELK